MSTRSTIALALLWGLITFATIATADDGNGDAPQHIRGDFRVVITQMCVRTPYQQPPANGFDPDTHQLLVDGETVTAIASGLLRFTEDGTVQMLDGVQTEVSVNLLAPGKTPITPPSTFTCNGTYTMQEKKVALTMSCDVAAPQPGLKVTLGPQNFAGYIDPRQKSINLTDVGGGIQKITVSLAGNPIQERQRVCTQNAMAAK
jgi:hypothetical protein